MTTTKPLRRRSTPGWRWRVLAERADGTSAAMENDGQFDELMCLSLRANLDEPGHPTAHYAAIAESMNLGFREARSNRNAASRIRALIPEGGR